jgi:penicillin-binding protein 1A
MEAMTGLRRRRGHRWPAAALAVAAVASGCSYTLTELSAELPETAQSSVILAADGTPILTLHAEQNRANVTYDEIPRVLIDAVIAIEDERFWLHHGVDVRAILRAVQVNASSGGVAQGGSTITQQLVKQLLLTSEQTLDRKIAEAALAWQLEQRYTKERILELYLNTIYFGSGAYGVAAAATEYFGKAVAQLTVAEAALLAGLIQSPSDYDPQGSPEEAIARRQLVLDAMLEQTLIDQATFDAASVEPLTLAPDVPILDQRYAAAHFVEEVKQFILRDPRFGATAEERRDLLFAGGITVRTTIDLTLQSQAEQAVAAVLPDPAADPEAALVAIDPATGFVRAMVGGRDYFGAHETAKYNLAMGRGRHTGSSFKPLVLAAALQAGMTLDAAFPAPGSMQLSFGEPPQLWTVGNYGEGGPGVPVDLREATVRSYNTVFAQLILAVGTDRAIDTAAAMGITTPLDRWPSAVLGANDVQPLEMASAYATLANRGVHVDPVMVTSVVRSDGTILYENEHHQSRVLDPYVADQVTDVLTDVIERGTGQSADIGRPAAGKTGTAQAWRNAMFCGYVPQLATAVWVGYPGREQFAMVPPRTPIRVTGGSYPAQIWQRFMAAATANLPVLDFPVPTPPSTMPTLGPLPAPPAPPVTGPAGPVPSVVGQLLEPAVAAVQAAGFRALITTAEGAVGVPGTVIGQSPAGGNLGAGAAITLVVIPAPPPPPTSTTVTPP